MCFIIACVKTSPPEFSALQTLLPAFPIESTESKLKEHIYAYKGMYTAV